MNCSETLENQIRAIFASNPRQIKIYDHIDRGDNKHFSFGDEYLLKNIT